MTPETLKNQQLKNLFIRAEEFQIYGSIKKITKI